MIDNLIIKADTTCREAELLFQNNYLFGSVSRLYYAAYFIISAYLLKKGFSPKTHKGLIKLFNQLSLEDTFIQLEDKSLIQTLFDSRQESDYGDFITFHKEEVLFLMAQTKNLIIRYKLVLVSQE
jgi:uncharacterized protein (UPF0332 family)